MIIASKRYNVAIQFKIYSWHVYAAGAFFRQQNKPIIIVFIIIIFLWISAFFLLTIWFSLVLQGSLLWMSKVQIPKLQLNNNDRFKWIGISERLNNENVNRHRIYCLLLFFECSISISLPPKLWFTSRSLKSAIVGLMMWL